MTLHVDLSALHRCVEQMGARDVPFTLDISPSAIEPIDIELREGIEIPLDEIRNENGLLSYKGRQILLYIRDHGDDARKALEHGENGRRFHIADCDTLQEMRAKNRFGRYYVTNDLSGTFEIAGRDPDTGEKLSGRARLRVCKNCLRKLNYKGYAVTARRRWEIWADFSIPEFFSKYSSCFSYLPYHPDEDDAQYTADWDSISTHLKRERGFVCEQCGVRLEKYKFLLHVHHINGQKNDNKVSNLKLLCADCHRKQESHGHMFVSHEHMRLINRLRREQGIGSNGTWEDIAKLADPALEAVISLCKTWHMPTPTPAYVIRDRHGNDVCDVELAWPDRRIAVVIAHGDKAAAETHGWQAWKIIEVLDDPDSFIETFKQRKI